MLEMAQGRNEQIFKKKGGLPYLPGLGSKKKHGVFPSNNI
ncbi:unknown protein [Parachlamydia acanthamoebae UV-7]|jgi:hypothetical protein|uniref:Uncharacterized protein n=2 Tax=Parachlamydia acanthamoebae TaxID=83552 RepID=F8KXE9_PARAV|nr:hypothetical protein DB43_DQ00070 [Parachlamydia acanthamoebae]CCB85631.1 unknown protein [Parachlamydia acanthamoebae UV-7]